MEEAGVPAPPDLPLSLAWLEEHWEIFFTNRIIFAKIYAAYL
jgi:hypothetical protein